MSDTIFVGKLAERAKVKIAEYPHRRSAIMPLCYMLQAEVGYVSRRGMREIAALIDVTPAEVYGTASFYTIFKLEPIGKNLVSICTSLSCQLNGADELWDNVIEHYEVEDLGTTSDGAITIEEVECLAACGGAPCLQVDYRFFEFVAPDSAVALIEDVKARGLDEVFAARGSTSAPLPPVTDQDLAQGVSPLAGSPKALERKVKAASNG